MWIPKNSGGKVVYSGGLGISGGGPGAGGGFGGGPNVGSSPADLKAGRGGTPTTNRRSWQCFPPRYVATFLQSYLKFLDVFVPV